MHVGRCHMDNRSAAMLSRKASDTGHCFIDVVPGFSDYWSLVVLSGTSSRSQTASANTMQAGI